MPVEDLSRWMSLIDGIGRFAIGVGLFAFWRIKRQEMYPIVSLIVFGVAWIVFFHSLLALTRFGGIGIEIRFWLQFACVVVVIPVAIVFCFPGFYRTIRGIHFHREWERINVELNVALSKMEGSLQREKDERAAKVKALSETVQRLREESPAANAANKLDRVAQDLDKLGA